MCIDLWKLWIGPILLCGRQHEIGTLCRNSARKTVRERNDELLAAREEQLARWIAPGLAAIVVHSRHPG